MTIGRRHPTIQAGDRKGFSFRELPLPGRKMSGCIDGSIHHRGLASFSLESAVNPEEIGFEFIQGSCFGDLAGGDQPAGRDWHHAPDDRRWSWPLLVVGCRYCAGHIDPISAGQQFEQLDAIGGRWAAVGRCLETRVVPCGAATGRCDEMARG